MPNVTGHPERQALLSGNFILSILSPCRSRHWQGHRTDEEWPERIPNRERSFFLDLVGKDSKAGSQFGELNPFPVCAVLVRKRHLSDTHHIWVDSILSAVGTEKVRCVWWYRRYRVFSVQHGLTLFSDEKTGKPQTGKGTAGLGSIIRIAGSLFCVLCLFCQEIPVVPAGKVFENAFQRLYRL